MAKTTIQEKSVPVRLRARVSFESVASRSARYRPDVDGLRAVAVLAVIFYHLGFRSFRSGLVGVDVFYVISGYLITSLLVKDLEAGRFSIISFYERRMRRIFPALFTVLFVCTLAASVLFDPPELAKFGKELLATTFFASNFYFWHSAQPLGYFDTGVISVPLLHTWSLSVEEQFYLFFPITLYLLFRYAKKRISAWLLLLIAASFALNLWATQHKPVVAFYWIMPRAWELLAGALLAMKAVPHFRGRILREIVALLGLAMILVAASLPLKGVPFPGTIVLLPCLGTWLVIYAGESGSSFVAKVLSLRPVVFVGVISYSLYLWHWPLIVFSEHLPFRLSGYVLIAFVLLSSLAAAFVSFEYIERPFRGSTSPFIRRQIFAFGFAASVASAAFGLIAYRSHGLPERYAPQTRQLIAANLDRVDDFDASCGNFKTEVHSINDIKFCNHGQQLPHKIMFWGDSHVEQLHPVIEDLYNRGDLQGRGAVLAIEVGCFPDEHINNIRDGFHCDSFARFAERRAQWQDVDLVFIGFSGWLARWDNTTCLSVNDRCVRLLSQEEQRRRLAADLSDVIHTLRNHGKRVVVSLPFPIFSEPIPDLAISNRVFGRFGLSQAPKEVSSPSLREEIRATAVRAGAEIFDPRETLCPDGHCITEVDGVSIYKDESHIAGSQVHILESSLREVLKRSLAEQTLAPQDAPSQ
jgi:peptidoglycan/LPS O-acetylase OafA/YrhL